MAKKKKTGSTNPKATPPSKQRRRSARLALAAEDVHALDETIETLASELPKYKDDTNAFNTPVEDGKDYVSAIPSEMLDRILGYCVMDHEPELAARQRDEGANFVKRPHVLLSLAAMSTHFKAHVENFCRLEMTRNKDSYRFRSTAEIVDQGSLRRSARIKAKPPPDHRCYRMELIRHLQRFCIGCGGYTDHFAAMVNTVKCHGGWSSCERSKFPGVIDLTTALRKYDLRDWMLIKARKPGPRAKKVDLPTIHYGTIRSGTPLSLGMTVSYRFYEDDVKAIAKIVHGDVHEHMSAKQKQLSDRRLKKRRAVHRELKIRHHTDMLEISGEMDDEDGIFYHADRLEYYTSPEWDANGDSDRDIFEPEYAYGEYEDVHSKICENKAECDICWEIAMGKYHTWFY